MTTKMTYANALEMVLDIETVKENTELVKKLNQLLDQVSKKNGSTSKKEKAKQEENQKIKELIMLNLDTSEEKALAIKELQAQDEELGEYTNQKLSALIRQLVQDGKVIRTEEKRVAKFYLDNGETVEETDLGTIEKQDEFSEQ